MSETCKAHSGVMQDIENLKDSDKRQWVVIEKLQNRLPVWATLLISVLTFALGVSLTYARLSLS